MEPDGNFLRGDQKYRKKGTQHVWLKLVRLVACHAQEEACSRLEEAWASGKVMTVWEATSEKRIGARKRINFVRRLPFGH